MTARVSLSRCAPGWVRSDALSALAILLAAVLVLGFPRQSIAAQIRLAVASNFKAPMVAIAKRFEASSAHEVLLSFGSTGKHYAQIVNGAPFDAFFAADRRRPERLEEEGAGVKGSRFTYALGKVVLWSPRKDVVDADGAVLARGEFRHLAIANPKLAPYGEAARSVLQARGLWQSLAARIVRGENIAQTFQFVVSGNAELGFIAYSQAKAPGRPLEGSLWEVPQSLYAPIEQQVLLLRETAAARDFLDFMRSDAALHIMREYGYETP